MKPLLSCTEGDFRILIFDLGDDKGTAIAHVSALPSWCEPGQAEPFSGESRGVLSVFPRAVIDASDITTLPARDLRRLICAVQSLSLTTDSSIVIAGASSSSAWVEEGFPVFMTLSAAIEFSTGEGGNSLKRERRIHRWKPASHVAGQSRPITRYAAAPAKSSGKAIERQVASWLHTTKIVLIEIAIFTGFAVFAFQYATHNAQNMSQPASHISSPAGMPAPFTESRAPTGAH